MAAIEVSRVSYRYPGAQEQALDDVSFTVEDGSFLSILGPSGCGKSTLMRLLTGLSLPTAGEIRIGGGAVAGPAPGRGIVMQRSGLFPWLTTLGNVAFAISKAKRGLSRQACREQARTALERVGLGGALGRWPGQLSGGMAQRVSLARALAVGAEVLLLDEAFTALDPKNRRDLQGLLLELWESERKTVVFVTHDVDEAIYLSDRILFMEPGRIRFAVPVEFGRPRNREEVLTSPRCCAMRKRFIAEFGRLGEAADECL